MPEQAAPQMQDRRSAEAGGSGDNLPLLYQGLITGIIRLSGQRQQLTDVESLRRRTKATLQEIERVAVNDGYDLRDVRDTHFAVVAFLDEAILHCKDAARSEWEQLPLQQDMYNTREAGVIFFEKLDQFRSRQDSQQLADILEVYLLCLLLGFQGRYAGARRGELEGLIEGLRMRIEYVRGRLDQISPCLSPPMTAVTAAPVASPYRNLSLIALGAVVFTLLWLWILHANLASTADAVGSKL